jgi:GNAT superfamily N-acetyltransferase
VSSSSRTSVISFDPSHEAGVISLWRALHPDWTWLDDPAQAAQAFKPRDGLERIRYVIERDGAVIATAFASRALDTGWPRNRSVRIDARLQDIDASWLGSVLASVAEADRDQPDTWHVVSAEPSLSSVLGPLLEAEGFVLSYTVWRIEWSGVSVNAVDPSPLRFECYTGGSREIDRAIVDLHNRSYRTARPKPPADIETLWTPYPGAEKRGFVLAIDDDRVVGFAEWSVGAEAWVTSFVVARSHWGRAIGAVMGAKVMQVLVSLGQRKMIASVRSTNTAIMRLWRDLGWQVASEMFTVFVRKL